MNTVLATLIQQRKVDFDDIFEAYAELCIQQTRDITEDMILDAEALVLTTEALTARAVDWALTHIPEMIADVTDKVKKDDETFLEFIVRAAVIKRVDDTNAFRVKLS